LISTPQYDKKMIPLSYRCYGDSTKHRWSIQCLASATMAALHEQPRHSEHSDVLSSFSASARFPNPCAAILATSGKSSYLPPKDMVKCSMRASLACFECLRHRLINV
jgi:hypothetical protein